MSQTKILFSLSSSPFHSPINYISIPMFEKKKVIGARGSKIFHSSRWFDSHMSLLVNGYQFFAVRRNQWQTSRRKLRNGRIQAKQVMTKVMLFLFVLLEPFWYTNKLLWLKSFSGRLLKILCHLNIYHKRSLIKIGRGVRYMKTKFIVSHMIYPLFTRCVSS